MSRVTSLTPEVSKLIIDTVKAGNFKATACNLARVHRDTVHGWEQRGDADIAAGNDTTIFARFVIDVREAEAQAERDLLADIRAARPAVVGVSGPDLWQAKAWMMERRFSKRWGLRIRAAVNEELESLIKRLEERLDAETFAKVVDATREEAPGEATDRRH